MRNIEKFEKFKSNLMEPSEVSAPIWAHVNENVKKKKNVKNHEFKNPKRYSTLFKTNEKKFQENLEKFKRDLREE